MKAVGSSVSVTLANASDVEGLAHLIADAFAGLAVAEWLVPDPTARRRMLARVFAIHVEHAVEHGTVHTTDERTAVAVWFPCGARQLPPPTDYDECLAEATRVCYVNFAALDRLLDDHHPAGPHHHLAFLAVAPHRQGEGIGSALLAHHHRQLDAVRLSAYLEASSPGSRDLYTRHGYRTGEPFNLPDGGPPFWPMTRPHHRAPTSPPQSRRRPSTGGAGVTGESPGPVPPPTARTPAHRAGERR
jgi:GNAT superfamily N-acetyltransferase